MSPEDFDQFRKQHDEARVIDRAAFAMEVSQRPPAPTDTRSESEIEESASRARFHQSFMAQMRSRYTEYNIGD